VPLPSYNRSRRRPVRVLLADDNPLYADAVSMVLGADPRIEIVGHARDGREAIEAALALSPDLVLMDIHMPVVDGVEATRSIRTLCPDVRVVALTSSTDREDARRIRLVGASGFLRKDCALSELVEAVVDAPGTPLIPRGLDLAAWVAA
jgi:DNA-binding NarL/FixJ family response regulator